MKTSFLKQFIICALAMNSIAAWANIMPSGQDQSQDPPVINGNPKPSKIPAITSELTYEPRWDMFSNDLFLYIDIASEGTANYSIYNEFGIEVYTGTTILHSNRQSSIYIGMLIEGVYSIKIECNGAVYSAIFEL